MTTKLFHITHYANLEAILAAGELRATSALRVAPSVSIAHARIQSRRASSVVPCGPGGSLHDYVPFYFGPRSPMLYSIRQGKVDGYDGGEGAVVHLVTTAEAVVTAGRPFVFTDGHAAIAFSSFYDDLAQLAQVDLALMRSKSWGNTNEDPDRKRRRQAEFLVHESVPWPLVQMIAVRDNTTQATVQALVRRAGQATPVEVQPRWYYGDRL